MSEGLNINWIVRVNLSTRGLYYWDEYLKEFRNRLESWETNEKDIESALKYEGELCKQNKLTLPLWKLMNVFGHVMKCSGDIFFKKNWIEVIRK
tara:strand:- start:2304 stop:2585 length:282 start_codon:yes stop_codon:yes gene_type:complete